MAKLHRVILWCLLFCLGFCAYRFRPRPSQNVISPEIVLRIQEGRETRSDRASLAAAVARACGLTMTDDTGAEPYLVWGDFLPEDGRELALAAQISPTGGLLAVLAGKSFSWHPITWVGPHEMGVPTSLMSLRLPGIPQEGLFLTDLADQMSGAFCRREMGTVLYIDGNEWRRAWSKEIESEAFWNSAWEKPPAQGWLRLSGEADWRLVPDGGGLKLLFSYCNTLSTTSDSNGGRLPEAGEFRPARQTLGSEEYYWDPALRLFVLGYGRALTDTGLLTRQGLPMQDALLSAGEPVAILADESHEPGALLKSTGLVSIYSANAAGYLDRDRLAVLSGRPEDLPAGGSRD